MKKILVVLALLTVFGIGYSVSGKIYVRLNNTGVEYEYRNGTPGDTWFIQQQKEGTGFDLYFDSFGLTYRMLSPYTVPFLDTPTIGSAGGYKASTPGYFQFRDLKFIPGIGLSIGVMWHQLFANASTYSITNATTNLIGSFQDQNTTYNRLYFTIGFNTKIGDSVEIKTYDWNHSDLSFEFGNNAFYNTNTNAAACYTNDNKALFKFHTLLIPQILVNADPLVMVISPGYLCNYSMLQSLPVSSTNFGAASNDNTTNYQESLATTASINVFATYGIDDTFSAVGSIGYVYDTAYTFIRSSSNKSFVSTNTCTATIGQYVPWFVGVKINIGGKAKMTLGWGYYWEIKKVGLDAIGNVTNLNETANYQKTGWDVASSGIAPDNIGPDSYDIPFLRFNGVATFAQYWQLGLDGAVTLNDPWQTAGDSSYDYHAYTKVTSTTTTKIYESSGQLLKFANLLCWDQGQGYIKYEDNAVVIKGEFAQRFANGSTGFLNMFSYLTLGVKF